MANSETLTNSEISSELGAPLWTPAPDRIEAANITKFIKLAANKFGEFPDYQTLHNWSVTKPQEFWPLVWDFCEIRSSKRSDVAVANFDRMPGAKFFPDARLNFAENFLWRSDAHPALVLRREDGYSKTLSYSELNQQVSKIAAALRANGVSCGDRVAGYLPNIPETVIAMLACTSIGAIWSSCSPDFGINGVLDRFGQIKPKVLFTADGYLFKGKVFDSLSIAQDVAAKIPTIEKVVVIPYLSNGSDLKLRPEFTSWEQFALSAPKSTLKFEQLPFDHPVYILYSSGTTGKPKCIVHGAGGTLIEHKKELILHSDLKPSDRIFYYTTCGWMMWNWLVSALTVGSTVMLFDGSPAHPNADSLFDFIQEEKISIFGTSARYIAATEKSGCAPKHSHDLSALKTILSTGSPLSPNSFDYVYSKIKSDLHLASISGGTDIVGCFVLGNPIASVFRGEIQVAALGKKVAVFDDSGNCAVSTQGELVCTAPFPAMPIMFWNDPDGSLYKSAYFDHYPGVWRHGDYAEVTKNGGFIIYGRSDAVLNPGGVRIGTAEIYRQVETIPEVLESLVTSQKWQGDERVILFVKLKEGVTLDDLLSTKIRHTIRSGTTARHVPAKILAVPDIPRTVSGKIVELAVRNIIHGLPVKNRDALANPNALDFFHNLKELES